jgi:methylglyoxal synthase
LKRNIALVAHDNKKADLVEWAEFNKGTLALHNLYATGGTGKKIIEKTSLEICLLKDGSLGGDMEIGAMIANEKLEYLIFFWDPLESLPHDVDVKALLRIAVLRARAHVDDCSIPDKLNSHNLIFFFCYSPQNANAS